jgi:hypothetical protein
MARPSEDLSVAWASLASAADGSEGWRSTPVSRHGALLLHAGRRFPGGTEALLARFGTATLPATTKLPEGTGFWIERASPKDDGVAWLALTRKPDGNAELFSAMARDIADALDACHSSDEPRGLSTLLGRVRAWQEFMRKGATPLEAQAEIGLFGELTALREIIEAGVDAASACESWIGPLGGLRDFEIGTGGLEVKSTLSTDGFPASVGTLEQLDDSARQPLFVTGLRLRQTASGTTLPDAVEAMRDIVTGKQDAERLLAERLIAAGYFDAHADQYIRRFDLAECRLLRIEDGFPRMTPWSVPTGVIRASYDIDLDKAPGQSISLVDALKELKAL